jgi:mannose-1-phosphate guanylyltransferase/phosphomannomutase
VEQEVSVSKATSEIPVFILAAGEGSRMFPFSSIMPKPLLPVGNRPFVRRIVEQLNGWPVTICCLEEDKPKFEWEFRDMRSVSFITSKQPKGTAGQLEGIPSVKLGKYFLVWYGDVLVGSYQTAIEDCAAGFDASLVMCSSIQTDYGTPRIDDKGNIIEFKEKSPIRHTMWTGVAVFKTRSVLPYLRRGEDFASDVFPAMLRDGRTLHTFMEDRYVDIGTYDAYRKVQAMAWKKRIW